MRKLNPQRKYQLTEVHMGVPKTRAVTQEEARKKLFNIISGHIKYWKDSPNKSIDDRLNGLVFSIFGTLDGVSNFCSVDLVLRPHPSDKEYNEKNGENWFEDGMVVNDDCMMHEEWKVK